LATHLPLLSLSLKMPAKHRPARPQPAPVTPARRGGTSLENLTRRRLTRTLLPTIHIVCDGQNTEPSCFNQFWLASARVITVGDSNNISR